MSPVKQLKQASHALVNAVNAPRQTAILDSLLYLERDHTQQCMQFSRFLLDLYLNEPINMVPLRQFSTEVRGWCLTWIGTYMRGEIGEYATQIQLAAQRWLLVWDSKKRSTSIGGY